MAKRKFERNSQLTLSGATQTEEEWAAALEQVENILTRCPFCLESQYTREMCFANRDGGLSPMRRCRFCHARMQGWSSTIFLKGPGGPDANGGYNQGYGWFVGTYDGFWKKVDHEKFMAMLDRLKTSSVLPMKPWEFWIEYRRFRPKKLSWEEQEAQEEKKIDEQYASYLEDQKTREEYANYGKDDEPQASPPDTRKPFTFKSKDDGSLTRVMADSVTEDDTHYVAMIDQGLGMKQRFKKAGWELIP